MTRRVGGGFVGVNRIGLTRGLGKEFQAALFNQDLEGGFYMANVFVINPGQTF